MSQILDERARLAQAYSDLLRPLGYTLVNVDYYNVMYVQTKVSSPPRFAFVPTSGLVLTPLRPVCAQYIRLFGDIPTDDMVLQHTAQSRRKAVSWPFLATQVHIGNVGGRPFTFGACAAPGGVAGRMVRPARAHEAEGACVIF